MDRFIFWEVEPGQFVRTDHIVYLEDRSTPKVPKTEMYLQRAGITLTVGRTAQDLVKELSGIYDDATKREGIL